MYAHCLLCVSCICSWVAHVCYMLLTAYYVLLDQKWHFLLQDASRICTWHFMSTSRFLPVWHITFPATCHVKDRAKFTAYNGCSTDDISSICPQHDTRNFMLHYLCSTGAWHIGILLILPHCYSFILPLPVYLYYVYIKWYNTHKQEN